MLKFKPISLILTAVTLEIAVILCQCSLKSVWFYLIVILKSAILTFHATLVKYAFLFSSGEIVFLNLPS